MRAPWARAGDAGSVAIESAAVTLHAQPQQEEEPISQLSMVCFLEDLAPERMPVSFEARGVIAAGLNNLGKKPVLEAVLLCLERLSEGV